MDIWVPCLCICLGNLFVWILSPIRHLVVTLCRARERFQHASLIPKSNFDPTLVDSIRRKQGKLYDAIRPSEMVTGSRNMTCGDGKNEWRSISIDESDLEFGSIVPPII